MGAWEGLEAEGCERGFVFGDRLVRMQINLPPESLGTASLFLLYS